MRAAAAVAFFTLFVLSSAHQQGCDNCQRFRHQFLNSPSRWRVWNNPTVRHLVSLPSVPLGYASEQASRLWDYLEDQTSGRYLSQDNDGHEHVDGLNSDGVEAPVHHGCNHHGDDTDYPHGPAGIDYPDCQYHPTTTTEKPGDESTQTPTDESTRHHGVNLRHISNVWKQWLENMNDVEWEANWPYLTRVLSNMWDSEKAPEGSQATESTHHMEPTDKDLNDDEHYNNLIKKKQEMERKLAEDREQIRQLEESIKHERNLQKQREEQKRLQLEKEALRRQEEEMRENRVVELRKREQEEQRRQKVLEKERIRQKGLEEEGRRQKGLEEQRRQKGLEEQRRREKEQQEERRREKGRLWKRLNKAQDELQRQMLEENERLIQLQEEQQELQRQRLAEDKAPNQHRQHRTNKAAHHNQRQSPQHEDTRLRFRNQHTSNKQQQQQNKQQQQKQQRGEVLSLQIPGEYTPRDIKVKTSGTNVHVLGKRVCDCDESCVVKEFERSYELHPGVPTDSLKATFYQDGHLSIHGAINQRDPRIVDTEVPVEARGVFQDLSSIRARLECLKKKPSFKMSTIDKKTGNSFETEEIKQTDYMRSSMSEYEDDGVTIEDVDE